MKFNKAKKIIKNKIIGVTCHNSRELIKKAVNLKPAYIAIGAFLKVVQKKLNIKLI